MTGDSDSAVYVHPQGLCESSTVGDGTRVWAFAHVMDGATIGADCNICAGAFVERGAVLGDGVTVKNGVQVWDLVTVGDACFLGPNATFTNDLRPRAFLKKGPAGLIPTVLERGVTLGANSTVVCGGTLGEYAFVAAGAVVVGDVAPHALVVGNPARTVGFVCWCGNRLGDDLACVDCGRRYRSAEWRGLPTVQEIESGEAGT